MQRSPLRPHLSGELMSEQLGFCQSLASNVLIFGVEKDVLVRWVLLQTQMVLGTQRAQALSTAAPRSHAIPQGAPWSNYA